MDQQPDYNSPPPPAETSTGIGLDKVWLKTLPSILKVVEMVLCLIAFICACANIWWGAFGGGWVQFVTISALITTAIFFVFHLLRVFSKLPGPWVLIEFIYYGVYDVLLLIAGIVAAAKSGYGGAVVASAIFTFAALAVYAVDTYFQFRNYQAVGSGSGANSSTTTATTTTTHTTYETRTQY